MTQDRLFLLKPDFEDPAYPAVLWLALRPA